jgi:type VI protein secretion system component Hcp
MPDPPLWGGLAGQLHIGECAEPIQVHSFGQRIDAVVRNHVPGKPVFSDVTVAITEDACMPSLNLWLSAGTTLDRVEIDVPRPKGGASQLRVELSSASVTRVSETAVGYQGSPVAVVSFSFEEIRWTHDVVDPDTGAPGGQVVGHWNLLSNQGELTGGDIAEHYHVPAPPPGTDGARAESLYFEMTRDAGAPAQHKGPGLHRYVDEHTIPLAIYLARGEAVSRIAADVYLSAGGESGDRSGHLMENVLVSRFTLTSGGADRLEHSVEFDYGRITWTHDTKYGYGERCWDVVRQDVCESTAAR